MPDPAIIAGVSALAGVGFGDWLNGRRQSRQFRRDFVLRRVEEVRGEFTTLSVAVNAQLTAVGNMVEQLRGTGPAVAQERLDIARDLWLNAFARSGFSVPANVQDAVVRFDSTRGDAVLALNRHDLREAEQALANLDKGRRDVLTEMNVILQDARQTQMALVDPWWLRVRRWWSGRRAPSGRG